MKDSKPLISISAGPFTILFFIFLTLKLCGVITWSWWWVFAPLIAWPAIAFCIIFFLFIFLIIVEVIEKINFLEMSCYECKWGPTHCDRYKTDGCWPNPALECFKSKEDIFSYSRNEKMYQKYLESNILREKTMQDTLEEIKNTFEDDTTEVQSERP